MTAWLLVVALAAAQRPRAPIIDPSFYDAVIVGGSLPALTAAWELERRGLRVLLLARERRLGARPAPECGDASSAWLDVDPESAERRLLERLGLPPEKAARGLEERLRASPRARVRVLASVKSVRSGEHLVAVVYAYQGLPHLARARRALYFGPPGALAALSRPPEVSQAAMPAALARVLPAQADCGATLGAAASLGERLADAAAGR